MKFLDLASRRYSCRSYDGRPVDADALRYVMECVRMAPSAVNKQPWRFRIVSIEKELAKLAECYNREWFRTAPMCIVASVLHDEEWVRADGKRHGDIDVAIAVEHLCLAATEVGLATCWVCNFDVARCKQLFDLPVDEEPAVLIPIGYATDEVRPKQRKALNEMCEGL